MIFRSLRILYLSLRYLLSFTYFLPCSDVFSRVIFPVEVDYLVWSLIGCLSGWDIGCTLKAQPINGPNYKMIPLHSDSGNSAIQPTEDLFTLPISNRPAIRRRRFQEIESWINHERRLFYKQIFIDKGVMCSGGFSKLFVVQRIRSLTHPTFCYEIF